MDKYQVQAMHNENQQKMKVVQRNEQQTAKKKPELNFRKGKFQIASWDGEFWKLTKSYKKQNDKEWSTQTMTLFSSEIKKLYDLLSEVISYFF